MCMMTKTRRFRTNKCLFTNLQAKWDFCLFGSKKLPFCGTPPHSCGKKPKSEINRNILSTQRLWTFASQGESWTRSKCQFLYFLAISPCYGCDSKSISAHEWTPVFVLLDQRALFLSHQRRHHGSFRSSSRQEVTRGLGVQGSGHLELSWCHRCGWPPADGLLVCHPTVCALPPLLLGCSWSNSFGERLVPFFLLTSLRCVASKSRLLFPWSPFPRAGTGRWLMLPRVWGQTACIQILDLQVTSLFLCLISFAE